MASKHALIIGNSDGIGLGATSRLLNNGWHIVGVSRSDSSITHEHYQHHVADITTEHYPRLIAQLVDSTSFDLCLYCAGIGEELDIHDMSAEAAIFEVNLNGMVIAASAVVPQMVARGEGHFIGLSSLADELLSAEAPSYHASKAGFTNYLKGLSRAVRKAGVAVTTVRFGFVDTKMAKGDVKPLMMSVEAAVDCLETCMVRRPMVYTSPRLAIPLVKSRRFMMWLGFD